MNGVQEQGLQAFVSPAANPLTKAFDFTQQPLPPLVLDPWPWSDPEPWSSFGTPPSASP